MTSPVRVPRVPRVPGYPYAAVVPTRWNDNDVYGHANNVIYYVAIDTVVNAWMIEHGLDIEAGEAIGLVVESGVRFLGSITYPDVFVLGLRIIRLGTSSVRWQVAMERASDGVRIGEASYVHVFVDRATRRPTPIPGALRTAMQPLVHPERPDASADGH